MRVLFLITTLVFSALPGSSAPEDSITNFFRLIESDIRKDYRYCTGDSSEPSLEKVITWKKEIDTIVGSSDFKSITAQFYKETGTMPGTVYPCDIISWKKKHDLQKQEISRFLDLQERLNAEIRAESVYVSQEVSKVKSSSADFRGIPFGIPKRCLNIMAAKTGMKLIDEKDYLYCKQARFGNIDVKVAFFLNKEGNYCKYELESKTGSLDSLDQFIRPLADSLASEFERITGIKASHSYRIGRFDITQGKLAIYKLWNLEGISSYVGLATHKYRYYAKAIITQRISEKMKNSGA